VDWIDLAQDNDLWQAVVNTVMNLLVLKKGLEILDQLSGCKLFKDSVQFSWGVLELHFLYKKTDQTRLFLISQVFKSDVTYISPTCNVFLTSCTK
jgi:hypothetical protein